MLTVCKTVFMNSIVLAIHSKEKEKKNLGNISEKEIISKTICIKLILFFFSKQAGKLFVIIKIYFSYEKIFFLNIERVFILNKFQRIICSTIIIFNDAK